MQKDSIHQEQVNLEEPSLSDLYPEYEQQNLKMPNLMLNNEEFMDILQKNPDFENFYPDRYLRSRKLFAEKLKFSEYYFSLILYLNEDSPLMIDLIKDLMNNQTFLKQISFDLIWKIFENLIERGKKRNGLGILVVFSQTKNNQRSRWRNFQETQLSTKFRTTFFKERRSRVCV
jgi:hypothetical protein